MSEQAKLTIGDKTWTFDTFEGTEGEKAIDTRTLRAETGYITFDEGYGNTGSCKSEITFIDGEKGILRHRGYRIEDLAEKARFLETAYLIIYGELPSGDDYEAFRGRVHRNTAIHVGMESHFDGFPLDAHPMAILSSLLNSLGCYYPNLASNDREQDLEHFDEAAPLAISKVRTLAAMAYRMKVGKPFVYPDHKLLYSQNLLHMMFSEPYEQYVASETVAHALDLFLLLHADHEQNCSTSTVRMVASGGANLFASVSAGVSALWGPLHGGANMAVIRMLEAIHKDGDDGSRFIEAAKRKEARLMGFGHRVYRNFDPRAKILGKACTRVLDEMGKSDPLLDIARRLEQAALEDSYFIDRKLYPNVDFYSGILLKAIGIPVEMFTVLFAIGRLPGWLANWREIASEKDGRIHRPRQIYTGPAERDYIPLRTR
ncbi:citrate synthase [Haloferula sargassicola]|uniref:Citrate synthase n=1 Tax=Haloferula sargassicola TaxID=490096 RepID=A0ABP9UII3_9BACT